MISNDFTARIEIKLNGNTFISNVYSDYNKFLHIILKYLLSAINRSVISRIDIFKNFTMRKLGNPSYVRYSCNVITFNSKKITSVEFSTPINFLDVESVKKLYV